jgi:hypothetical protein
MRRALPVLVVLAATVAGCGSDPAERFTLRTPPEHSSADALPEVRAAQLRAARAAAAHPTRRDARPLLRKWAEAVRHDASQRAARLFALPAVVSISQEETLETLRQVRQFNDALPCGTRLLRVQPHGRFVIGRFALTKRPQHSCPTTGQRIRVAFALQNGLIAEWRQLAPGDEPAPARPEGAPDPPVKLAA